MSFSPDWLALRAPADDSARDTNLIEMLDDWAASRPGPLQVVDLGCGSGATFRALDPHLPGADWFLVDNDPRLLEIAMRLAPEAREDGAGSIRTGRVDLAASVEAAVQGVDLVTASALMDLVSPAWIERLVRAMPRRAALYAPLIYDGAELWTPAHPAERRALAAFREHQRGDKGFGPALGPDAAEALAEALIEAGWEVRLAPSAWRLSKRRDGDLIRALAVGSAEAVAETGALDPGALRAWSDARADAEAVLVGHQDLLALPKD